MEFIDDKTFLKMMKSAGIVLCDENRSICYEDKASVLGFDFTNLAISGKDVSPVEVIGAGDRNVEYAMVSTLFSVMEKLDIFPLYLYTITDEWGDENLDSLIKRGLMTNEEGEALSQVADEGHGMDVAVIEKNELAQAVRLIAPQFTIFQTTCCAVDGRGLALAVFSHDDEVSFNTTDQDIYIKAGKMVKSLKNLPFETVWAQSA